MKQQNILILLVFYFDAVLGLQCHECRGDPGECAAVAVSRLCQSLPNDQDSDQVCSSRYTWNDGVATVIKGCEARKSCRIAENANDCGSDQPNKSCQCCCDEDNCNSGIMGCAVPMECPDLAPPSNGVLDCERPIVIGTSCDFNCLPGYKLVGENKATCYRVTKTGKVEWNNIGQICELSIRCLPALSAPLNGKIRCKNSRNNNSEVTSFGTRCVFTCNAGYRMSRPSRFSACQRNGLWSRRAPECVPLRCPRFPIDLNRWHACSFSDNVGSVCQFQCNRGYQLIGNGATSCILDNVGKSLWAQDAPICQRATCQPQLKNPANGKIACTDSNLEGSICISSCNEGYDVEGNSSEWVSSTCVIKEGFTVGTWTQAPAVCNRIKCFPKPTRVNHVGLRVNCTDDNHVHSQCSFSCDDGYDLDGTTLSGVASTCFNDADGDDVGVWGLYPFPYCSPILCYPKLEFHANGIVVCDSENNLGSTCIFRCHAHYDIVDTSSRTMSTTCVQGDDAIGQWSNEPPECAIITCPTPKAPNNGMITCTDGNNISSRCKYTCDQGHELNGTDILECRDSKRNGDDIGEWSAEIPSCQRRYCPAQDYDRATVIQRCQSQDELGRVPTNTQCSYSCANVGHYLQLPHSNIHSMISPQFFVTCMESKRWNQAAPRCSEISCVRLVVPERGNGIRCTKENSYGSVCEFTCDNSSRISHSRPLTCVSNSSDAGGIGVWNDQPPTCITIE